MATAGRVSEIHAFGVDSEHLRFSKLDGSVSLRTQPGFYTCCGVLWFHVGRPCVCLSVRQSSVRPSVFRFRMITWVNINGFSSNLVCALILWRSGLGLLMGKFQILRSNLPETHPYFRFRMISSVKHQWIFTKFGMCIDIVEILFGIAYGQILTELSARDTPYFRFPDNNLSKCQGILTKLGTCTDMKEIWFGVAYGQISSMTNRVICPRHDNGGVL